MLLRLSLQHLLAFHQELLHFSLLFLLNLELALQLFLLQLFKLEQLLAFLSFALSLLALLFFGRSLLRLLSLLFVGLAFRGLLGCLLLGSRLLFGFTLFLLFSFLHALHLLLGFLFSLFLGFFGGTGFSEGHLKCLPLLVFFLFLFLTFGCRSFTGLATLLFLGLLLRSRFRRALSLQLLTHLLLGSGLLCLSNLALLLGESFSCLARHLLLLAQLRLGLSLGFALFRFELLGFVDRLRLQFLLLFSLTTSALLSGLELLGLDFGAMLRLSELLQASRPLLLLFLGLLPGCLGFRLLLGLLSSLLCRLFLLLALRVFFLQLGTHLRLQLLLLFFSCLLGLTRLFLLGKLNAVLFFLLLLKLGFLLGSFLVGFLFVLLRLELGFLLADLLGSLSLLPDGSSDLLLSLNKLTSATRDGITRVHETASSIHTLRRVYVQIQVGLLLKSLHSLHFDFLLERNLFFEFTRLLLPDLHERVVVLLERFARLEELVTVVLKLLLGLLEATLHGLLTLRQLRVALVDRVSSLHGLLLGLDLTLRQFDQLVVVQVSATRILVVCDDGQLVEVLANALLKIRLQLGDCLLSSSLRIEQFIVEVHLSLL